jgi:hypothetical protein
MLRRPYVVFYSKVALLAIEIAIGIGLVIVGMSSSGISTTPSTIVMPVGGLMTVSCSISGSNEATYQWVPVMVSVSGLEHVSGMTTTSFWNGYPPGFNPGGPAYPPPPPSAMPVVTYPDNVLTFNLIPGTYTVSGTYNGIFRSESATVTKGGYVIVILSFGGTSTTTVTTTTTATTTTTTTTASNEAENRVGDWVLSAGVTPDNITAGDNITVWANVKYVGSDNYTVIAYPPSEFTSFGPVGNLISHPYPVWIIQEVNVWPQRSWGESWQYFEATPPGIYELMASSTAPNPDNSIVSISVELFVEVKPGSNPITQTTTTTPLTTTTTLGGTTTITTPQLLLTVGGAVSGSKILTISYTTFGDTIENAYTDGNWTNMEVMVNGAATPAPSGTGDFSVGDNLTITLATPLASGDVITVIYIPTSQTLASVTVP